MTQVLQESRRTQHMTPVQYFEHFKQEEPDALLPPMFDGSYMTLAEYRGLLSWARAARAMDAQIQRVADEKSWATAVCNAYVSAEREVRASGEDYPSADVFGEQVMKGAVALIENASKEIVHYIPCYLFSDPNPETFHIGPVEFVSGSKLAARAAAEYGSQPDWFDEYTKLVNGDQQPDRRASKSHWSARIVWEMSKSPWIAIVRVSGHEPAMSRRRAEDAARLAIAGLSTLLHPETAAKMGLANEWGRQFVTRTMGQVPGSDVFGGASNNPPQVLNSAGVRELLADHREYLDWCGELITECLTHSSSARVIRECWLNALHWYYTGCLEPADARAVICFSTALESLADGDGSEAIVNALEAIFAVRRTDVIAPWIGWTLQQTIDEIYGPARSEVVHGGRFVIFREYHHVRSMAAELCRLALVISHKRLREYESATRRRHEGDSKSHILRWLRARKP
jgi:hypothetical protein